MDKTIIRKNVLNARKNMQTNEVLKNSEDIFKNLVESNVLLNYNNILVYADFKNEVKTGQIIQYLRNNLKNVYLPVCNIKEHTFEVSKINFDNFETKTNCYGIEEPIAKVSNSQIIDCAIVPGVAFGINGNRIGFGGGYYDKFFEKRKNVFKIGICYEFQICDYSQSEKHDIPMNMLITEKRVIHCRNAENYI